MPQEINGGWILLDEKEREELYHDTYQALERYIKPLKEAKNKRLLVSITDHSIIE